MATKNRDTRDKILSTAGKLFSQRGYYGVSMQDIADHVGITKAALYYHFQSKDDLAEILLRNAVSNLKNKLKIAREKSRLPSDTLFNLTKTFLDFKIKHPEITLLHSLGLSSDEKIPLVQFVVGLRTELIKFIRNLIQGIDFARKMTYRTALILTTTLMSFVLHPFNYKLSNHKQLAKDLTALLLPKTKTKGK